ncbi:hypothetical protein WT24_11800 [Burkholderia sp. MSMB1078WGS]|nr:hypothetical protein WT24_11800 [Burkholderia sp. MSMB1078WGS]
MLSASRTASTLNSFVYCRLGTTFSAMLFSIQTKKLSNFLLYVDSRQGHGQDGLLCRLTL